MTTQQFLGNSTSVENVHNKSVSLEALDKTKQKKNQPNNPKTYAVYSFEVQILAVFFKIKIQFNLNLLGLLRLAQIATISLFHVRFSDFPSSVHKQRFQGGCEWNQGRDTSVIPSSAALPASPKPSLTALRSCHTFFMMAWLAAQDWFRMQLGGERGDKCNAVDISRATGADLMIKA